MGTYGRWLGKRVPGAVDRLDARKVVAERPKEVADGRAADVQTSTAGYSEGPDLEATGGEGGIRTPGTGFSPVQQISNLPCSATPAPLRNELRAPLRAVAAAIVSLAESNINRTHLTSAEIEVMDRAKGDVTSL